jgi:hypothetical protein
MKILQALTAAALTLEGRYALLPGWLGIAPAAADTCGSPTTGSPVSLSLLTAAATLQPSSLRLGRRRQIAPTVD